MRRDETVKNSEVSFYGGYHRPLFTQCLNITKFLLMHMIAYCAMALKLLTVADEKVSSIQMITSPEDAQRGVSVTRG